MCSGSVYSIQCVRCLYSFCVNLNSVIGCISCERQGERESRQRSASGKNACCNYFMIFLSLFCLVVLVSAPSHCVVICEAHLVLSCLCIFIY